MSDDIIARFSEDWQNGRDPSVEIAACCAMLVALRYSAVNCLLNSVISWYSAIDG